MKPELNPFAPGSGLTPPALLGRDLVLEQLRIALVRVQTGYPETPTLLYGLRGVGKTVVLHQAETLAQNLGYATEWMEVDERKDFDFKAHIINQLKPIIGKLDTLENVKGRFGKLLSVFKSLSLSYQGVEFKVDVEPLLGEADSANFAGDLSLLCRTLGEAARDKGKSIALFIDEVQNLQNDDLAALLAAMHRLAQLQLPFAIVCAGLPSLLNKIPDAKTYAERFNFYELGPLTEADANQAFSQPFAKAGVSLEPEALGVLADAAKGYAYFIQRFGRSLWDIAKQNPITKTEALEARAHALQLLDSSFFETRFERSTEEERKFMFCMAEQPAAPYDISSIKSCLGKAASQVTTYKNRLIAKGFIYQKSNDKIDFTVPLFQHFLRRKKAL